MDANRVVPVKSYNLPVMALPGAAVACIVCISFPYFLSLVGGIYSTYSLVINLPLIEHHILDEVLEVLILRPKCMPPQVDIVDLQSQQPGQDLVRGGRLGVQKMPKAVSEKPRDQCLAWLGMFLWSASSLHVL